MSPFHPILGTPMCGRTVIKYALPRVVYIVSVQRPDVPVFKVCRSATIIIVGISIGTSEVCGM